MMDLHKLPDGVRPFSVSTEPTSPIGLFGYVGRTAETESTLTPLEANGIVFKNGSDLLVLVALDALYGGEVGDFIGRELGLSSECILVLGSHTHFAPGVDRDLDRLGETRESYLQSVAAAIARGVRNAMDLPDAQISGGVATVRGLFVNRRRPILGGRIRFPVLGSVMLAPNETATTDNDVRALILTRRGSSRPLAVVWGVSCHPVCSPEPLSISACFPGVVRTSIREHFEDPDLPVLFVQGFSGDVRPVTYSRTVPLVPIKFVSYLLGGGRLFRSQSPQEHAAWCNSMMSGLRNAFRSAEKDAPADCRVKVTSATTTPTNWRRSPVLKRVAVSPRHALLAVNAEVVSERVKDLGAVGGMVLPAGCADRVIGYWPTDQMISEGGYEGCRSQVFFPNLDWHAAGGPDLLWHQLLERLRSGVQT